MGAAPPQQPAKRPRHHCTSHHRWERSTQAQLLTERLYRSYKPVGWSMRPYGAIVDVKLNPDRWHSSVCYSYAAAQPVRVLFICSRKPLLLVGCASSPNEALVYNTFTGACTYLEGHRNTVSDATWSLCGRR